MEGRSLDFVVVSPAMAQRWLDSTKYTRPLRKSRVSGYAKGMREGNWAPGGSMLIVTPSGRVVDGQHRLRSVIASGLPIVFVVQTIPDAEAERYYGVVDLNAVRSCADMATYRQIPNAKRVASICNASLNFGWGKWRSSYCGDGRSTAIALYDSIGFMSEFVRESLPSASKAPIQAAEAAAVLHGSLYDARVAAKRMGRLREQSWLPAFGKTKDPLQWYSIRVAKDKMRADAKFELLCSASASDNLVAALKVSPNALQAGHNMLELLLRDVEEA